MNSTKINNRKTVTAQVIQFTVLNAQRVQEILVKYFLTVLCALCE